MLYIITFALTTRDYAARVGRFLETGGPPPAGATMAGRWITLGHDRGFMLVESDDPGSTFRWTSEWADLIDFEVHPVLENAKVAEILGSM